MTNPPFPNVHPQNESCTSVQPHWCRGLSIQQQSVLFLGARGPDGVGKHHECKNVVRAYRACVLIAAERKRELNWGERADSFMSLDRFAELRDWRNDVQAFLDTIDELPYHYVMHLVHGAQILAFHHPEQRFRIRWDEFYLLCCEHMHLNPETIEQMDDRLNDVFS